MSDHNQPESVLYYWAAANAVGLITAGILAVEEHPEFWKAATMCVAIVAAALPAIIASVLAILRSKGAEQRLNTVESLVQQRTREMEAASIRMAESTAALLAALALTQRHHSTQQGKKEGG